MGWKLDECLKCNVASSYLFEGGGASRAISM
jgi:hypothetical protein